MPSDRRSGGHPFQRDAGGDGSVIRGHAYPRPVQSTHILDPTGGRCQDAIQRQERASDGKAGPGRAVKPLADQPRREGHATPGTPFVQIPDQDGLTRRAAPQMLSDHPHLRDSRGLTE